MKKQLLLLFLGLYSISGFSQFFEGFENTTGPDPLPSNTWTLSSGNWAVFVNDDGIGATEQWKINNSIPYQGVNAACINQANIGQNNTEEDYLVTPLVDIPLNGQLKFFSRTFTNGNQGTLYQIKVAPAAATQNDPNAYTVLAQYTESEVSTDFNIYEEKTVDLSAFAGQPVFIAFVRKFTQPDETLGGDQWLIDNVSIAAQGVSACPIPANLMMSDVLAFSATVDWASQGNQYQILVLPTGEPGPASDATSGTLVSTSSYNLTGLTPATTYDVYVKTICSGLDNSSEWVGPLTFVTQLSLTPLVTNNSYTPQQLINNVLVDGNPCFSISNVTSSTGTNYGSANGLGYFTNTNSTFPLSSGIVLSTGSLTAVPGPNTSILSSGTNSWAGDTELTTYLVNAGVGSGSDTYYNATKLEFDFASLNEFMSFNFLFASEEYGTFQCDYSDAFAFFLTDLTTGIKTNLAVVPGTNTPISVVTVRDNAYNGACNSSNPDYFGRNNAGTNASSSATNFNGQTEVMTASSALIPGHNYHIKLVVADRGDATYDSAVFIEAGSFSVGPPICSDKAQLVAFVDDNNNGVKDVGENNFTHGSFVVDQNNSGAPTNVSTPLGTYTIYDTTSNTYDFSYAIDAEFGSYYAATATSYNDIHIASNPNQVLYFPVTLTQGFNDVTVAILPSSAPRPGFVYNNIIQYKNLGNTAATGILTFVKDPAVTIVNVNTAGIVNTTDGFSYSFTNLAPNEARHITVSMSVPPLPTVALSQLLTDTVTISAPANDINLTNNDFANTQVIVGSYDPNDKMEAHGGKIQFDQFSQDEYLYYTVRFQNTGTANALDVRLEDVLDAQLDETSFEMVDASHNYVLERKNNQLVWKFNYINLIGAIQNEELSKGYVTFKIKVKPGFAIGDIIPNKARIYFDTNPAIVTNTFNTEFVQSLGNPTFNTNTISLYPNPASTNINIIQNNNDTLESLRFYDVSGKTIKQIDKIANAEVTVDISALAKGIYFVEIITINRSKVIKKLIVQ
jgi:hypothetical protein